MFPGREQIEPTVTHPTAAIPNLYNRFAPPFVFLITDLPEDFRRRLVDQGVIAVNSWLTTLFVQNGTPAPHDFITTLTNYNMRTDSELLMDRATEVVRKSVIDLLFDIPSDTSNRITRFISLYRDNLDASFSDAQARLFVRNSVKVKPLQVIVPGTKTSATIYNVYIYPPTTREDLLKTWRGWIAGQKYYADRNGVGRKYDFTFRCNHCKSLDHPTGLCPWGDARTRNQAGVPAPPEEDDDLLPLGPIPGPSNTNDRPARPGGRDAKGRGKTPNPTTTSGTRGGAKKPAPRNTTTRKRKAD